MHVFRARQVFSIEESPHITSPDCRFGPRFVVFEGPDRSAFRYVKPCPAATTSRYRWHFAFPCPWGPSMIRRCSPCRHGPQCDTMPVTILRVLSPNSRSSLRHRSGVAIVDSTFGKNRPVDLASAVLSIDEGKARLADAYPFFPISGIFRNVNGNADSHAPFSRSYPKDRGHPPAHFLRRRDIRVPIPNRERIYQIARIFPSGIRFCRRALFSN